MNQELLSGGSRMTTGPVADAQSTGSLAKRHGLTKRDIIGIVLGVPVSLIGFHLVTWPYHRFLYPVVGLILVLISVGLFIPSRHYERGNARAFGFMAVMLVTGVAAFLAGLAGACWLLSSPDDEFGILAAILGAVALAGFAYALACTIVLLKKFRPGTAQALAATAAGVAAGSLTTLVMYVLHLFE
jgi:hypothetical protein